MIFANKRASDLITLVLLFAVGLAQSSCQPLCQDLKPQIICPIQTDKFTSLPSPFTSLSQEEKSEEWAKELLLGDAFAKEWDLYRAITCYKRALILLPADHRDDRRLQLHYTITLSYYLGNKYKDALTCFETTELSQVNENFPAFKNLLLIVYDCYLITKQPEKAACVMQAISIFSPHVYEDLNLYESFKNGEIDRSRCLISTSRNSENMKMDFAFYDQYAKSPKMARTLNALLPGAGYYYVGEKRSALTSFLINALFTAAAYQFFHHGYPAAGAITTSLELGWYFGGINGAGIEAQEFNTRLFESVSQKILMANRGFPILMFETSF